jgi:hypothetical protein
VLELSKAYSTPYSAVLRDDVVMGVPRYFLERWLPLLGPDVATVINTLRQLDYRSQEETIAISGEALARQAAMSRRHLYTCLEAPWVSAFVRVQTGRHRQAENGTITQETNRYAVRMDDPLVPADAEYLCELLPTLAPSPIAAARQALSMDPRQLWARSPRDPAPRFPNGPAITARQVLQRAFQGWHAPDRDTQQEWAEVAEALHRHLTLVREDGRTSKVIVPQYFRARWWARLGHDLAWAYLWLRGTVYDNPDEGQRRDTCWLPALDGLLTALGRSREWWRRNVETPPAAGEEWALADFFCQLETQKGRDPAHPQRVARQFRVALDIPVAPEDRALYATLLRTWPAQGIVLGEHVPNDGLSRPSLARSATNERTGEERVRHKRAHRIAQAPPQTSTPEMTGSATIVHTGDDGVRHNGAQGSAPSVHRNRENLSGAPQENQASPNSSKHPAPANPAAPVEGDAALAAAVADSPEPVPSVKNLREILGETLRTHPETPFCNAAPIQVWLRDSWPTPVQPHTPAWMMATTGRLSQRDLVALILAVCGDKTVEHPPRYLSWLLQRWQALPDIPPVEYWDRWQMLAQLPLRNWLGQGRYLWRQIAQRNRDLLPFDMDLILGEAFAPPPSARGNGAPPINASPAPPVDDGLDACPGEGTLTMRDIWRATMDQLHAQLNRTTYTGWVEGAQPVSYVEGVLTVRARNVFARDLLAQRLNQSIEQTVSALARTSITVRFTAGV